ncbi:hypothetical protein ACLOJK_033962 [Asimina triloba]
MVMDAALTIQISDLKGSMDLETENRIAAILMEEATRLRLQAEKEGVGVYLRQPKVRGQPNSRFLSATVLGVQQANRTAEVNEMWRVRKKELELDDKLRSRSEGRSRVRSHSSNSDSPVRGSRHEQVNRTAAGSCTSRKRENEDCSTGWDAGLRDEEIEEFLHSRMKRGRGAVGSRMDEPGPYLQQSLDLKGKLVEDSDVRMGEEWEQRVLGPEKPAFLKCQKQEVEAMLCPAENREAKKIVVVSSKKSSKNQHSKDKSKRRSRDKIKKETKFKHRHGR